MKKVVFFLLAVAITLLQSCRTMEQKMGEFRLLPQPRTFTITGSSSLSPDDIVFHHSADGTELPPVGEPLRSIRPSENESSAQIVFGLDPLLELKPEGYLLEISRERITISGKDKAGLLYGFKTLEQLMEDAKDQEVTLPLCTIEDEPQLAYRAIHIDVKHHLEQKEYYYQLLNTLAAYKINAVIAEMEDKLGYLRQPAVASSDAMSMEEWKELSVYAMERNIEISPLIQGLGHASFILKHEEYRALRDDPASDWAFNPLDPRTYEVQFDLYRDALEATPYGRYLHVGGDEVETTGRGSGKSPLELQLAWLNRVCEFAAENGRIPIFWDDMPLKQAEVYRPMFNTRMGREEVDSIWDANEPVLEAFLDRFPRNCVYMRWNYSTPQTYGNEKAMEWFREHGLQVMGATAGQTRWVLMPQEESNMENIRTFALSSMEKGLDGLLLTLWDDDSPHFELYMRGIAAFAAYSWSGDQLSKEGIKAAYRQRAFSPGTAGEEYAFIDRLEGPVSFWNNALLENRRDRRSLRTMDDPLGEGVMELPDPEQPGRWSEKYADRLERAARMKLECDTVAARIAAIRSMALRNTFRLEVYEQVNLLARYSAEFLLALQSYDAAEQPEKSEHLGRIRELATFFPELRTRLEEVYGRTRILSKPADYLLDQDHHEHLANQTISFDWLFTAELFFLDKVNRVLLNR